MFKKQIENPRGKINFKTKRLLIREFTQNDLEPFLAYEKQPGMVQFEDGIQDFDSARNYIDNAIRWAEETPRTNYCLAVTIAPLDVIIGRISLTSQNPKIREWEIGWSIQIDHWGNGFASEAAYQLLEFAFQDLNAHRVVAFCHAGNTKSKKVMEKIGMTREGCLRQTRWFKEAWEDEFVYAILDNEHNQNPSTNSQPV